MCVGGYISESRKVNDFSADIGESYTLLNCYTYSEFEEFGIDYKSINYLVGSVKWWMDDF